MLENCGISDLENLSKNRKKLLELHNTTDVRDPVNLARNYFIFTEILNVDLDTNLSVLAQLTHTSRWRKIDNNFSLLVISSYYLTIDLLAWIS